MAKTGSGSSELSTSDWKLIGAASMFIFIVAGLGVRLTVRWSMDFQPVLTVVMLGLLTASVLYLASAHIGDSRSAALPRWKDRTLMALAVVIVLGWLSVLVPDLMDSLLLI